MKLLETLSTLSDQTADAMSKLESILQNEVEFSTKASRL